MKIVENAPNYGVNNEIANITYFVNLFRFKENYSRAAMERVCQNLKSIRMLDEFLENCTESLEINDSKILRGVINIIYDDPRKNEVTGFIY